MEYFGMNVTVTAGNTTTTYYNVTEVHYNHGGTNQTAFESDIHYTGINVSGIQEMTVVPALKLLPSFDG